MTVLILIFVVVVLGVTVLILIFGVVVVLGMTVLILIFVVVVLGVTVFVLILGVTVFVFILVVVVVLGVTVLVLILVVVVVLGVTVVMLHPIDEFVAVGRGHSQLHNLSTLLQIRLGQSEGSFIQMQPIHEDQIGLRQLYGIRGSRLERMRVDAWRHDAVELDAVAADIVNNVPYWGDRSDDAQSFLFRFGGRRHRGAGATSRQEDQR